MTATLKKKVKGFRVTTNALLNNGGRKIEFKDGDKHAVTMTVYPNGHVFIERALCVSVYRTHVKKCGFDGIGYYDIDFKPVKDE